ncbi:BRO1-domain-containing protein [Violaceomyces palustris]|uniref:BRO1-domain-containing protein n=1 Tax=Violaceomyces palustris TaxID=1673888 RepID=A0ACD0P2W8_9BASI|nr:BRO1-domain-containing protein [Violaceomyces palustris]
MSDSHQSPLIAFPAKTTEEVDIGSAVKSLIINSYGEDPSNYAEQISALNRSRQDAVKGAGSDATARDLLYKWFHMLEMLELRFPELRVPFPWKDAFTQKPISQLSLAYEKASIIFNIAAVLSSLASSQSRLSGNPEGIKRSFSALRQAAGMLSYINDNFLHAPSTDMSRDVVKTLVGLMLAQASEVFYEKTVEEKKSNGLISKLASNAAASYSALVEDTKEFASKLVFDRLWLLLIQVKAKHFSSVTQYYRALADDASGSHGSCLVRLTLAESQAKEAQRLVGTFASYFASGGSSSHSTMPSDAGQAMTAIVAAHLSVCSERKATAVKDNDLIYHDILPSESALPAVEKLVAASPISIQDIFAAPEVQKVIGPDVFQKLVPLGVHESASMYSEEKAKVARSETERHELANGELQAALDYMGLPASLNKYRDVGREGADASAMDALTDPGAEVMRWAEEEAQGGGSRGADGLGMGIGGVEAALDRISSMSSAANSEIEAAQAALDDENRECERLRVKYGHRWTQEPSGLHTKALRTDLKENREALRAASSNDERIVETWRSIKPYIQLLVSGRERLEQAFAEALANGRDGAPDSLPKPNLIDVAEDEEKANEAEIANISRKVTEIDAQLTKLHKIKKERAEVLSNLKEKIQSDDISQLLILNRRSQSLEPALFAAELEKFKPHQNRIAVSIHHQKTILGEIAEAYKELSNSSLAKDVMRRWEEKEKARNGLISKLRKARDENAEVRAAVAKGLKFYSELGDLVKNIRQGVNRFVSERRTERERLLGELEWEDKLEQPHGRDAEGASFGGAQRPSADDLLNSFSSLSVGGQNQQNYKHQAAPPALGSHPQPLGRASGGSLSSPYAYPAQSAPPPVHPSFTPTRSEEHAPPFSAARPPATPQSPVSPYDNMFYSGPFADASSRQGQQPWMHPSSSHPDQKQHSQPPQPPPPPAPGAQQMQQAYHQPSSHQQQRNPSLPPPPPPFQAQFSGGEAAAGPPTSPQYHAAYPNPSPLGHATGITSPPPLSPPPQRLASASYQHPALPPPPPLPYQQLQQQYERPSNTQYTFPPPPPHNTQQYSLPQQSNVGTQQYWQSAAHPAQGGGQQLPPPPPPQPPRPQWSQMPPY